MVRVFFVTFIFLALSMGRKGMGVGHKGVGVGGKGVVGRCLLSGGPLVVVQSRDPATRWRASLPAVAFI